MIAESMIERFARIGLKLPRVALPRVDVDYTKWAVIACDQFTSDPGYWNRLDATVGSSPSSLRLILPEVYLGGPEVKARTNDILRTMRRYLDEGILTELDEGFVIVRRVTPRGLIRTGLLAAVDLERYDYHPDSTALIRATEGTIPERIPPRTTVRCDATLELPHVLVLYDDPENTVISGALSQTGRLKKIYDFDLLMGSGHLTGYHVVEEPILRGILEGFERLADPQGFARRHDSHDLLLFAVGDGNHSLAAAKAVWEDAKRAHGLTGNVDHPARYALVELINIHDPGLEFEPIHRVVFGGGDRFLERLANHRGVRFAEASGIAAIRKSVESQTPDQHVGVVTEHGYSVASFSSPSSSLAARTFQDLLDEFLSDNRGTRVDYIHGEDETDELGSGAGNAGFFLPAISKADFFATVVRDGSFPRKTFSMGEAEEKRFYFEARRITGG